MLWRKITASLLSLILISLLLVPHSLETLPSTESDHRGDAAHFPAFVLLSLLVFSLLPCKRGLTTRLSLCAAITITVAVGSEWLQSFTPGRMASLHDLTSNGLGILAALSGIWIWKNSVPRFFQWKKILHLSLTLLLAALLAWPYYQHLNARFYSQKQFPLLSHFHDLPFALLWKSQNGSSSTLSQSTDPPRLVVSLPSTAHFAGINYLPGSQNWSSYSTLHLTLHNPGSPYPLGIRIDDDGDCSQLDSRFNDQRLLNSGRNHFTFDLTNIRLSPKNREINLHAIHRLLLFTQKNPQTQQFSIIKMWLEK